MGPHTFIRAPPHTSPHFNKDHPYATMLQQGQSGYGPSRPSHAFPHFLTLFTSIRRPSPLPTLTHTYSHSAPHSAGRQAQPAPRMTTSGRAGCGGKCSAGGERLRRHRRQVRGGGVRLRRHRRQVRGGGERLRRHRRQVRGGGGGTEMQVCGRHSRLVRGERWDATSHATYIGIGNT